MEIKNGYFRMDIREMGVFLQIIPPENGGKRPEIKEILDYLEQKGYSGFNLKELNDAVTVASTEVKEVYVGEGSGFQEDEQMEITVPPVQVGVRVVGIVESITTTVLPKLDDPEGNNGE